MVIDPEWYNLIKCGQNFYWDFDTIEKEALKDSLFFREFCDIKKNMTPDLWKLREHRNHTEVINTLFSEIYDLATRRHFNSAYFLKGSPLYDSVYGAYLYSALCLFLYYSKRRKRKSLSQFTYDNSLNLYNKKESQNFCSLERYGGYLHNNRNYERLYSEVTALRKERHRKLSNRTVYDKFPQWSIMSSDLEYEWHLYHILSNQAPLAADAWFAEHNISSDDADTLRKTLKRIGNLYNDIQKVQSIEKNDTNIEQFQNAYKKFESKLSKIKYENYLKLQKTMLSYLCEKPEYLGTLLYRYEKENKPYVIISEVNRLLNCKSDTERADILYKSIILKDICFPKLYNDLFELPSYIDLNFCIKEFSYLRFLLDISLCLTLEDLICSGFWNDKEWEDIFFGILNQMSEKVFYNPNEIDFSNSPNAQEYFSAILAAPVQALLLS